MSCRGSFARGRTKCVPPKGPPARARTRHRPRCSRNAPRRRRVRGATQHSGQEWWRLGFAVPWGGLRAGPHRARHPGGRPVQECVAVVCSGWRVAVGWVGIAEGQRGALVDPRLCAASRPLARLITKTEATCRGYEAARSRCVRSRGTHWCACPTSLWLPHRLPRCATGTPAVRGVRVGRRGRGFTVLPPHSPGAGNGLDLPRWPRPPGLRARPGAKRTNHLPAVAAPDRGNHGVRPPPALHRCPRRRAHPARHRSFFALLALLFASLLWLIIPPLRVRAPAAAGGDRRDPLYPRCRPWAPSSSSRASFRKSSRATPSFASMTGWRRGFRRRESSVASSSTT